MREIIRINNTSNTIELRMPDGSMKTVTIPPSHRESVDRKRAFLMAELERMNRRRFNPLHIIIGAQGLILAALLLVKLLK